MSDTNHFRITRNPELLSSTLIVGWEDNAGGFGAKVADHLIEKLGCLEFAEIEPESFFPLAGVLVEDDVAHFPECKFYYSQERELVVLKSRAPRSNWYEYMCSVLDLAEQFCYVRQIYTVGGIISFRPHTLPRETMAVANSHDVKIMLQDSELATSMSFETPPGQRPTLSSLLLWAAQRRNVPAAGLWVPMPFYLLSTKDAQSSLAILRFLDRRLRLRLDFRELEDEASLQLEKLSQLRLRESEIDSYIRKLETSEGLSQDEAEKLAHGVEQYFKGATP